MVQQKPVIDCLFMSSIPSLEPFVFQLKKLRKMKLFVYLKIVSKTLTNETAIQTLNNIHIFRMPGISQK